MKKVGCAVLALLIICMLFGCESKNAEFDEISFYTMGTIMDVKVQKSDNSAELLADCETRFENINDTTNRLCETPVAEEKSEIKRINNAAGKNPVKVSDEVYDLIKVSVEYGEKTNGKFNILLGPISDLWGFDDKNYRVPSDEEIKKTLELCNLSDIVLDDENKTVFLKKEGMEIDLGALAKGYATDAAVEDMKNSGCTSALINAGGNIGVIGKKDVGQMWKVGIQNPRKENDILGYVEAEDEYVVTSGDYQRYFEQDGVRYCHIFDAETGYPANGVIASSVICDDGLTADILSTTAFIMGDDFEKFIENETELSNVAWLIVSLDENGDLIVKQNDLMKERLKKE